MLSNREVTFGILMPLVIAFIVAAAGWWTKRAWLLPVAGGTGFLAGYASSLGTTGGFGLPHLPPNDGSDWLFWTTIPAILVAALSALARDRRWLAVLGAWAGIVVWCILHPLSPSTLSPATVHTAAIAAALLGIIVPIVLGVVADRIGHGWIVLSFAIAVGATGATVLASNLRTVGVYGLGAGAAFAGVVIFTPRLRSAQSLAILGISILTGLLAAGHYYPDPGVGWPALIVLLLSPLLALAGLWTPANRKWIKGMVAVLVVTIAVAAVTAPAAIAAKRAAEEDPYGNTGK